MVLSSSLVPPFPIVRPLSLSLPSSLLRLARNGAGGCYDDNDVKLVVLPTCSSCTYMIGRNLQVRFADVCVFIVGMSNFG